MLNLQRWLNSNFDVSFPKYFNTWYSINTIAFLVHILSTWLCTLSSFCVLDICISHSQHFKVSHKNILVPIQRNIKICYDKNNEFAKNLLLHSKNDFFYRIPRKFEPQLTMWSVSEVNTYTIKENIKNENIEMDAI